jgi:hypothetical protein
MTPKEKAIELTDKMFNTQNSPCTWQGAKICALIALDEILNNIMFFWYNPTKDMPKDFIYFTTQKKYWEQVKEEIEKL